MSTQGRSFLSAALQPSVETAKVLSSYVVGHRRTL